VKPALLGLAAFLITTGTIMTLVPSLATDLFRPDPALSIQSFMQQTDYGNEGQTDSSYIVEADLIWSGNIFEFFAELFYFSSVEIRGE